MTSLAAPVPTETQQALIDARLDTIDRILLGRVPREDRLGIIREVESQIQELLLERDAGEISTEDVIDVLKRLDPPEAYLLEQVNGVEFLSSQDMGNHARLPAVKSVAPKSHAGRTGGILGVLSFGLTIIAQPMISSFPSVVDHIKGVQLGVLLIAGVFGFSASIIAIVLSIRGRSQGTLPVMGIILGTLASPVWLFTICFVFEKLRFGYPFVH